MEDRTLSETLSATQFFPDGSWRGTDRGGSRHVRHSTVVTDQKGKRKASVSPDRAKKRGRPRIASANVGSGRVRTVGRGRSRKQANRQHQDRRTQVRVAQRAYRLKKETKFREMENRLSDLEANITNIASSLSAFYQMAIQSDLHITHPGLFRRLVQTVHDVTTTVDSTGRSCEDSSQNAHEQTTDGSSNELTFGYTVEHVKSDSISSANYAAYSRASLSPTHAPSPPCIYNLPIPVERPLGGQTNLSFSFYESSFSRRLHRFCLEHIYRLVTEPRTDPKEVYRVFRLMPCIRYKERMLPYLKCLAWAGPNAELETPAVPFYCIGGAGTHYPRTEKDGSPVYPENMRLPRKILGTLPQGFTARPMTAADERQELLKVHGLDGIWLDCRDVEGYLEAKGITFDQTRSSGISSPKIKISSPLVDLEVSATGGSSPSKSDGMESAPMHSEDGQVSGHSLSLDVDELLRLLLKNMIILGRAPGFRLSDVDNAFKSSVTIVCD